MGHVVGGALARLAGRDLPMSLAARRRVLQVLRGAADAESHVLQREPSALWAQFHERLRRAPDGAQLVADESARRTAPWLRFSSSTRAPASPVRTFLAGGPVQACRFTPDGRALVVADIRSLTVHDLGGAVLLELADEGDWADCATAATSVAAVTSTGIAGVWDRSGRRLARWEALDEPVVPGRACALSPDGSILVTGGGHLESSDGIDESNADLTSWHASTGLLRHRLTGHLEPVQACTVLPDGDRVLSTGTDGSLRLHDLRTGAGRLVAWVGDTGWDCAAHPGEDFYVVAGYRGPLTVWDPATGERLASLEGHDGWALACAVSPDGRHVISAGRDGTVRVWDPDGNRAPTVLRGHTGRVQCCDVSPDGRFIASGGVDGTVRLWELPVGDAQVDAEPDATGLDDRVTACAVSADGTWAATAGEDETIRIWDLPEGTARAVVQAVTYGHGLHVAAHGRSTGMVSVGGAVSPDGTWLAAAGERLLVLDPASGEVSSTYPEVSGRAVAAISAELLVASLGGIPSTRRRENGAVVLDVRTGERLASMQPASDTALNDLAVSPSGGLVAAVGEDWTVTIWGIGGGAPVSVLAVAVDAAVRANLERLHWSFTGSRLRRGLTGCRFLDEDRLVTVGFDGSVRLWDLATAATTALAFLAHPALAIDVWRPGRTIVCGDAAGGVHVLVVEPR